MYIIIWYNVWNCMVYNCMVDMYIIVCGMWCVVWWEGWRKEGGKVEGVDNVTGDI